MCPRSGTIERQREYKIDSIDGGRGGCGGGYVAQLRDFGSFVKQRDSTGDDRGPIGMLMPALSPSLVFRGVI